MRKLIYSLSVLACLCLFINTGQAFQQLPTSPNVKIGKLDNGFTYYIHANPKPENRIEFRLAVNAGSLQEDDDQQGLAHFSEHMLFNGTENFKKNDLIDFLQKMGLEFGGDLNAYTSFNETVYILPTPTDDPENLDKAMLVLSDWASKATFDNEEIDKERGVVMEEWRLGRGAFQRMREATWPIIFKGSKYAERLPIGKADIIQNAPYEAFKRFYRDWYRPDLMALIAVGDFDPAEMEEKIKKNFSGIKMPANPRKREEYGMPDFEETRVAIATDDESTANTIAVNYITPGTEEPKQDLESYRKSLVSGLFSQMMNQRLREKTQEANPPYLFSFSGYGSSLVRNKNEYTVYVSVKGDEFARGLKVAMEENERVRRHGFTAGELQRAKASYKNSFDRAAKEADKRESWRIMNSYVGHFLRKSSIMSPQQRLELAEQLIPTIQLDEINGLIKGWLTDTNRTISINAKTDNEGGIPTEDELIAILDGVKNDPSIEPYAEEEIASALMTSTPKKGSVTSSETNEVTGITKMTLSNGVKVYLKPTDFKNDELRMTAYSFGGTSLYSDEEYLNASNASAVASVGGLGEFSSIDLGKFMTGKTANVRAFIGSYEEGLSGVSSMKDMETFFQLVHMRFTSPRADEEAVKGWANRMKQQWTNFKSSPDFQYSYQLNDFLFEGHPRVGFPDPEDFDKIDMNEALRIYKERFADAGDFTFVFVGNIDMNKVTPLLETYIASLPANNSDETFRDVGIERRKGVIDKNFYLGVDEKSSTTIYMSGDYEVNLEENGHMNAAARILTNKMIETLREEMGGVYGVGARWSPSERPKGTFLFTISFPSGPENADALAEAAMKELEKVKDGDFTDEDLQKVIKARIQNFDEGKKTNNYWESMIAAYLKSGNDLELILKNAERANAITKEKIVATMNKYITGENVIKVVKLPASYKGKDLNQEIKKN